MATQNPNELRRQLDNATAAYHSLKAEYRALCDENAALRDELAVARQTINVGQLDELRNATDPVNTQDGAT